MIHALARTRSDIVARTRLVADGVPVDPFDQLDETSFAWWHCGSGFVASGVTARVPADGIADALSAIAIDDDVRAPGTGAIAVGALHYADSLAGEGNELVIPARVVGRTSDGRGFVTQLGSAADNDAADDVPTELSRENPGGRGEAGMVRVRQGMSQKDWRRAVERVLASIAIGDVDKVVLARDLTVEADRAFDRARIARHLRDGNPDCFVFAADGIIGASPELLIARRDRELWARPLAGTSPSASAVARARLGASAKDRREHQIVVDSMVAALARLGVTAHARGPEVVRFGDLAHLATEVTGTLLPGTEPSALDVARGLHPTPAVGGSPAVAAAGLIAELEPAGRGRYAAPVGWVGANGDGEWAIALRSAEIRGSQAVLRAGAGIVADSEPAAEWRETEAKFAPMLAALTRA